MLDAESRTIQITTYTNSLLGKGSQDGKEYFFPYVQIGDLVTFKQLGRGKKKRNQVTEIHSSRSSNFFPKCSVFGNCGGCRGQQIPYDQQFELKSQELKSYYHTKYGIQVRLVPAQKIWNYRNRMDFVVFPNKIGLHAEGNYKRIIDISRCEIQSELANSEFQEIKSFLQDEKIAYNRKTRSGFLKYITLRTNSENSELMLILTFIDSAQNHPIIKEIAHFLLERSSANHIVFCYNREKAEVSAQGKFQVIKGNSFYKEKILNKAIQVPFDSFFQPNPKGFVPILEFIQEKLENLNIQKLIDMFCGTGFFSIVFGDKFLKLSGFDIVPSSVEKAIVNLTHLYPNKEIDFRVLDLYQIRANFLEQDESHTLAIIDPPRNGLGKNILTILEKSNIPNLIYVSCNPHIQKLDYEHLANSYELLDLLITDPYPHTPHLESVMHLVRRK